MLNALRYYSTPNECTRASLFIYLFRHSARLLTKNSPSRMIELKKNDDGKRSKVSLFLKFNTPIFALAFRMFFLLSKRTEPIIANDTPCINDMER